ncbi:MAG: hypothetical protein QGI47_04125, partial [Candidatus Marinimicrobia bacterium]|nr:hypothetical protein [Candidatus Neomarinimicrobiota bacterium]
MISEKGEQLGIVSLEA